VAEHEDGRDHRQRGVSTRERQARFAACEAGWIEGSVDNTRGRVMDKKCAGSARSVR